MRTSADGRLRDRRPRARAGARAQGLRRGHHRRRGRGRPARPTRSPTRTSPRRPSASRRSRASASPRPRRRERGARRRGRAASRWAASARRPSTATARAWSRSSATASYGELLGAHIVGARATEMIAELVVAKQLEGGFEEVARTVHPHPTFSEAVMEARAPPPAGSSTHSVTLGSDRPPGFLLTTSARPTRSWRPSGSTRCFAEPPVWQPILLGGALQDPRPRLVGRRPTRARRGCARSSGAPPSTACRRCAGPIPGRATRCSRCGPRPSRPQIGKARVVRARRLPAGVRGRARSRAIPTTS